MRLMPGRQADDRSYRGYPDEHMGRPKVRTPAKLRRRIQK
jgi:hypothetical protein